MKETSRNLSLGAAILFFCTAARSAFGLIDEFRVVAFWAQTGTPISQALSARGFNILLYLLVILGCGLGGVFLLATRRRISVLPALIASSLQILYCGWNLFTFILMLFRFDESWLSDSFESPWAAVRTLYLQPLSIIWYILLFASLGVAVQVLVSVSRGAAAVSQAPETGTESIQRSVTTMENNTNIPGKGAATASLVLGIIAVVLWFFGYSAILSAILGVIGLVCAGSAKKAGFQGGLRTAGFVLSLIGLIVGAVVFIACIACVGAAGGVLDSMIY